MAEKYEYELTPMANVAFNSAVADEINRLYREIKRAEADRDQWKRICDIIVVCVEEMCDDYDLKPTANLELAIRDYREARKEKGI